MNLQSQFEPMSSTLVAPRPAKSERVLRRSCDCGVHTGSGGECSSCQKKRSAVARTYDGRQVRNQSASVPSIVPEVLNSPGAPLDQNTLAFMGTRLGHDFSHVRVHVDAKAAQSAEAVNATAYTVGHDLVFARGQYQPATTAGRQLLAHELTHVVQQGGVTPSSGSLVLGEPDSAQEVEAQTVSAGISEGAPVASADAARPTSRSSGEVQRVNPVAVGAAIGAAAAIVSFEAALSYGQSLATRFPGWLSVLPNCPCTEAAVLGAPGTWARDRNRALAWFHPGAASSYRSIATFSTVPGSSHGQQCTYDSAGHLLTDGPGAGTPDSWSPNTNVGSHTWYDVATWQLLGWRIYNRYWTPNNGNGCAANRGDNTAMRRFSEFIP